MGGGGGGEHSLWNNPRPSHLLQVSRESYIGIGQRMASGGHKPAEKTSEVGADDEGVEQGGGRCPDVGTDLLGSGPVSHVLQVG